MKNLNVVILFVLVLVVAISLPVFAGNKTMTNGILQIPKCTTPPTIDGIMDPMWKNVTAYPLLKWENGPADSLQAPYMDHFTTFRVMWDDDNFYAYVVVVDDTINTEQANPWSDDCIEMFFDGYNKKLSHMDDSTVQWRWVYGVLDTGSVSGFRGPGTWAWTRTNYGYDLELAIPKDSLGNKCPLVENQVIGFEISNNDNDNATDAQHVLHWWTTNGNTWNNPSLYGTAILSTRPVGNTLLIPKTDTPPIIDGVMDVGEWDLANEITLEQYEGAPAHPESLYTTMGDHFATAYTMWDDNNFYAYVKVMDDTINTVQANPWSDDCVEIFFDGYNKKLTHMDDSTVQWRWVYGVLDTGSVSSFRGPGTWAWTITTHGFDLELAIPKDSLGNKCPLLDNQVIGFEVSNNDNDNATDAQHVLHWWTTNGNTWNNPSLYGTAILMPGQIPAVGHTPGSMVTDYRLEQNYPNPFNPSTRITYTITQRDRVKLTVYNILGSQVAVLENRMKNAGTYTVNFDAHNLASGMYFYKLETGNAVMAKKMMLIK